MPSPFPPLGHCQIEGKSIEVCQDHPCNTDSVASPFKRGGEIPALEAEIQTGEIALVSCPKVNGRTHTFRKDQNAKTIPESTSKVKPKENNVKAVDKNLTENKEKHIVNSANEKNKTKRVGPEEFKLPKKFARVTKDLLPV
ncbi:hypothetical protein TNCT_215151 [Trichonephila clavata]|uniref:Uncharacterized protein n=1 Tax=Trichonephila clavata TaxID=2740835 RepID=A0A8X6EXW1_TRICU|nr:hypothetical protein TNCT_215151 [Trichonephila clavata]